MLTPAKINSIKKRRDKLFEGTLRTVREGIDRYEQSNMQEIAYLRSYPALLQDGWKRFLSILNEFDDIEEDDIVQEHVISEQYRSQDTRIQVLLEGNQSSIPSTSKGIAFPEAKCICQKCNYQHSTGHSKVGTHFIIPATRRSTRTIASPPCKNSTICGLP